MLKTIAIVVALVSAVGCGAARPQRPTQTFADAVGMYVHGASLAMIKTSLSLRDESEARSLVREGLMDAQHRYLNEY